MDRHSDDLAALAAPEEIIAEARAGRMFILIDDEDRENEGDLVIPAAHASAEAIAFMARHARGLVCLALTKSRAEALHLELQPRRTGGGAANSADGRPAPGTGTAFTVSIDAADGITTGITAQERSRTIAAAIDPKAGPEAIVSPGHVFPLIAKDGGVLVRAGHTEAAVDVARLAGLDPSGVICEIMNEDGTMARLPDLVAFAQFHGLKIGTIADLIAHRAHSEQLVEEVARAPFRAEPGGDFELRSFRSRVDGAEALALIKGEIDPVRTTLVRVHAVNLLSDLLSDSAAPGNALPRALAAIEAEGRGVLVLLPVPAGASLGETVAAKAAGRVLAPPVALREYGLGGQVLAALGLHEIVLLTNTGKKLIGLEGLGLKIIEQRKF
jgi:3,4-dihydroxy 2-butanone 4-phosphate synthase/GTP cyclohydrolase II